MQTAISCATCQRPLRVPDSLLGQTVRCPFCTDAFLAVADPTVKLEEPPPRSDPEPEPADEHPGYAAAPPPLDDEPVEVRPVEPAAKPERPPKPWTFTVYVRRDTDRRIWGDMQAELSAEGLRVYRGRKEFWVPVGSEATWVGGAVLRVELAGRVVELKVRKRHSYKSRLAQDLTGFLNGSRPMPRGRAYGWPWYLYPLLLAPLGLFGFFVWGELPETPAKGLKAFGVFLAAVLAPLLAYAVCQWESVRVGLRWTAAGLLVAGTYLFAVAMYWESNPPAATAVWRPFPIPASAEGPVTVQMPAPPASETVILNGSTYQKYSARVKPAQEFVLAYTELRGSKLNRNADGLLDQGALAARQLVPNAFVYSTLKVNLDGNPGRELSLSGSRGTTTVRIYLVGSRMYLLAAIQAEGYNGRRFFDSFKPPQ